MNILHIQKTYLPAFYKALETSVMCFTNKGSYHYHFY